MNSVEIFCCRATGNSQWQLVPLSKEVGNLNIIGWKQIPDDKDGEISELITSIMGSTLTAIARVTYPQSTIKATQNNGWELYNKDLVLNLGRGGLTERVKALVKNIPSEIVLISTRRAESVAPLFDDPVYPWWLQGQVALLSDTENSAPNIDRQTMLTLLNQEWSTETTKLISLGIRGLFVPGVDGDIAGFYSFSNEFETMFISEIQQQCQRANINWAIHEEKEFAKHLADVC